MIGDRFAQVCAEFSAQMLARLNADNPGMPPLLYPPGDLLMHASLCAIGQQLDEVMARLERIENGANGPAAVGSKRDGPGDVAGGRDVGIDPG